MNKDTAYTDAGRKDSGRGTTIRINLTPLILAGGLAYLAANDTARRRVLGGTRHLVDAAGHTLEETVKPALAGAAEHASHVAQVAAHRGSEAVQTLREEAPVRAHSLLETVQEAAGTAASAVAHRAADLTHAAAELAEEGREGAAQVTMG
ncbi:hypothetical protein QOL99_17110, partial [Deinococcus sp. MIMF12]